MEDTHSKRDGVGASARASLGYLSHSIVTQQESNVIPYHSEAMKNNQVKEAAALTCGDARRLRDGSSRARVGGADKAEYL